MPQISNDNFDAFNKELAKNVQYILEFTGLGKKFINRLSTEVNDALALITQPPESISQKIVDRKGKSDIGTVSVMVQDKRNSEDVFSLTKFVSQNDILGADATVLVGYVGLNESDFLPAMTGRCSDYPSDQDTVEYKFVIEDLLRTLIGNIFTEANEENLITLRGNPIDLILQIMTSTGNGTNGVYDVLEETQGLGIDQALVDIVEFESIRDNYIPKPIIEFIFQFRKSVKGIDFLEKQLYAPFNMNPFVRRDGKISITTDFPKLEIDEALAFTPEIIIGNPKWTAGIKRLINNVHIRMDWDEVEGKYKSEKFFVDATSISRFKREEIFKIETKGLHGANSPLQDIGGDALARNIALTILGIRSIPLPGLEWETFFFRWLSEVGDKAVFTHPLVPNFRTGDRGLVAEVLKIENTEIDFETGKVKLEATITDFSGKKYGAISTASEINSDETPTTTVFSVIENHGFKVGDAISVLTDELNQESVITDISDSAGGGGGSLNKITVSPALARTPNLTDIIQYATFSFVKSDGNAAQINYAYMSRETAATATVQGAPLPTSVKFTVDDASIFEINDVIKIFHDDFFEFAIIFAIVDDQIEVLSSLELTVIAGDTIKPEELETGDTAFVYTPSIGLQLAA